MTEKLKLRPAVDSLRHVLAVEKTVEPCIALLDLIQKPSEFTGVRVEAVVSVLVLELAGTKCRPAVLEITGPGTCRVTVTEGKYHQVKRMLSSRGKPVTELKRLSIGALALPEELEEGAVRELDEEDLCRVFMVR